MTARAEAHLPPLRLVGARVLCPQAGLVARPLGLDQGVIVEDAPEAREIDLAGYMILPAMVDLHGDGFERHVAPRRGAIRDLGRGLMALDAELAASGIGTAYLAQFYSWEGGMRGPDFAHALVAALGQAAPEALCDLRLQARLEINLVAQYADFLALVEAGHVDMVVFNDHLPHRALASGRRPERLTGQALKAGRSPEAHLAYLMQLHAQSHNVPQALSDLARALVARGVILGSHDAASADDIRARAAIGCRIAEFPESREAAKEARALGQGVIMGAPNLIRGGSHKGNVAAKDLIVEGLVDALASDYHYPALAQAALSLWQGGMDLPRAWALVSSRPAALMGLQDRGQLRAGMRADLVILSADRLRIAGTIIAGRVAHMTGDLARRMIG